jgi:hypothetical protein
VTSQLVGSRVVLSAIQLVRLINVGRIRKRENKILMSPIQQTARLNGNCVSAMRCVRFIHKALTREGCQVLILRGFIGKI